MISFWSLYLPWCINPISLHFWRSCILLHPTLHLTNGQMNVFVCSSDPWSTVSRGIAVMRTTIKWTINVRKDNVPCNPGRLLSNPGRSLIKATGWQRGRTRFEPLDTKDSGEVCLWLQTVTHPQSSVPTSPVTKVAILRILAADNQSYFHGEQLNIIVTFARPAEQ